MIQIYKSRQPKLLAEDIAKGAKIYPDDLSPRTLAKIRVQLLEDQGYICCYCQRRIPHKSKKGKFITPKSKIEHFKCQTGFPDLQLEFKNMFVACRGSSSSGEFTCDTKKEDLILNKVDFFKKIEDYIYYTKSGEIKSHNTDLQTDINEVLNLNEENLVKSRLAVYEAIKSVKKRLERGKSYQAELQKIINSTSVKNSSKQYPEFLGVKLYFLNK